MESKVDSVKWVRPKTQQQAAFLIIHTVQALLSCPGFYVLLLSCCITTVTWNILGSFSRSHPLSPKPKPKPKPIFVCIGLAHSLSCPISDWNSCVLNFHASINMIQKFCTFLVVLKEAYNNNKVMSQSLIVGRKSQRIENPLNSQNKSLLPL